MYIRSLLPLVEERSASPLTPELRMATARRPLARRLRRMLQCRYHLNPKVGAFAFSSLVLGVGHGLALSTEARVPAQAQVEEASPQIRALLVWVGAYFEESVDQLEDAQRVEVGGDFTRAAGDSRETGRGSPGQPESGSFRPTRGARTAEH